MEFRVHASGSAGNFYTVHDGNATLAIDPGISFRQIQRCLNFQVSKLDCFLISHGHGDHAKAAADMLKAGVSGFASLKTWCHIFKAETMGQIVCPGWQRMSRVDGGFNYEWRGWTIRPFEVPHDTEGTLGYLVRGPSGQSLLYATDMAYMPHLFAGINIIAVEANFSEEKLKAAAMTGRIPIDVAKRTMQTHCSIERVIEMLKANDLSQCREIHLLHLSNGNSDAEGFKRQVQAETRIPTFIGSPSSENTVEVEG